MGKLDVVLTAGPGWLGLWIGMGREEGDCAIVFANTCALIHRARVTSVIFTCCDAQKEESNRNSGLKLVGCKPFKMLAGATRRTIARVF